jgi:2-hydroxychromene-2-carboxylate isomerase
MARQIEFHFDYMSPYSYLATTQFAKLRSETGAEIAYKPFRILELMKLVGNRPTTVECKNKSKYAGADLARWAALYKVPFQRNPNMRGFDYDVFRRATLAAVEQGKGDTVVPFFYRAIWAGDANLAERPVLMGLLDKEGLDGEGLLKQSDDPKYSEKLEAATAASADKGVFGSPTFFVGEQMFFGNDRLGFLTEAAKAA